MAKIEILFLGTACMMPTKERNHQAILIRYKNQGILMDCGENTQRQLKTAGIKPSRITKILISHWHGDHILGLPGLLQSLNASEYNGTLEIYLPKTEREKFDYMLKAFPFDMVINTRIIEIDKEGVIFENEDFLLEAHELEHGVKTFGFNFIEKDRRRIKVSEAKKHGIPEGPLLGKVQKGKDIVFKGRKFKADELSYIVKGKKISYIADTILCNKCDKLVKNADLLISESAFCTDHEEKAEEYKHMTARQAALLASRAGVKKLVLTHFSQRYETTKPLLEDAKEVFENVECSYDFMKIKL